MNPLEYAHSLRTARHPSLRAYWIGIPLILASYLGLVFAFQVIALSTVHPNARPLTQRERETLIAIGDIAEFPLVQLAQWGPLTRLLFRFGLAPEGLIVFAANGMLWAIVLLTTGRIIRAQMMNRD